ncbi:MAG: hypothetical protein COU40_03425 [Candidatus Moranbacteria bacterium CG10_big_fil_rev_8_21_14_0_10_35_21]|nr:MAG: hypothetical protein COU40_03425 [Candidatus Moranbacteria bacterium CG10_big_fil_rev_8_21_14_0_10_35_21]PJA88363.1 MAG: hypothetical protein CO139_03550 [Candidatus Moranbacteria bacterium CG_4_9_14_3_um_filter_36_9]
MLFNIPQFIDKEDKIVGPLTAKQLGWMFGGGTTLLVLWNILDMSAFIVASVFVAAIFGALAFYRPNGQPLIAFIFSAMRFLFRPKMYLWKRIPETAKMKRTVKKDRGKKIEKSFSEKNAQEISKILDTQGRHN